MISLRPLGLCPTGGPLSGGLRAAATPSGRQPGRLGPGHVRQGPSSWPRSQQVGFMASAVGTREGAAGTLQAQGEPRAAAAVEQRADKYTQRWELRFRELQAFKAEYGHCNVPSQWPQYPSLGQWLRYQRSLHAQGKLCPERKTRLKKAGVRWSTGRQQRQAPGPGWDDRLSELQSFHRRHGHCHVPRSKQGLHTWANLQRRQRREGKLGKTRIRRLDELGFDWEAQAQAVSREERWNEQYEALRAFAAEFGHCIVPQRFKDNPSLGVWVNTQRKMQAQGRLSQDRVARLDELNFQWSAAGNSAAPQSAGPDNLGLPTPQAAATPHEAARAARPQRPASSQCTEGPLWRQRLRELRMFRGRYGHCSVPERYRKNPGLAAWVREVRHRHSQGRLSEAQTTHLKQIGLDLNFLPAAVWDQWVQQLAEAVDAHGGVFRLHSVAADNPRLARWVQQQRRLRRRGLLTEERMVQLLAIGANVLGDKEVESYNDIWEMRYAELEVHAAKHGYALSAMPTQLQVWVQAQRKSHRSGTLSSSRTELLDSIGFQWLPCWDTQFEDLMAYKRQHGDCLVPQHYAPNRQLGSWVRTQRRAHRLGTMCAERSAFLDAIGFDWGSDSSEDAEEWDQHFEELRAFHRAAGSCQPEAATRLGRWVRVQMHEHCMGRLDADRTALLDGLGLSWGLSCSLALSTYDQQWDRAFQSLCSFRETHGHCHVPPGYPDDPQLPRWVDNQRLLQSSGSLSPSRATKLTALGFSFEAVGAAAAVESPRVAQTRRRTSSAPNTEWDRRFWELCTFRETHGHCSPTSASADGQLVAWVTRQRMLRSEGGLLAGRAEKLSAIGFDWLGSSLLPQPQIWEKRFGELVDFQRQADHLDVPASLPVLFNWVRMQRFLQAQGSLHEDQARRLAEIGFDFAIAAPVDSQQSRWLERYEQLRDFRESHGSLGASPEHSPPAALSEWVDKQLTLWSDGSLPEDRAALLEALGLRREPGSSGPEPSQQPWDARYQELLAFWRQHGHCGIVDPSAAGEALADWAKLQACRRRQGSLTQPLVDRLAELGFWEEAWESMYLRLVEYLRTYGDCLVPAAAQHLQLHEWVQDQRTALAEGRLEQSLVQKLDRLGFYWGEESCGH